MDKKYYIEYFDLERQNWWFKIRKKIIENEVLKIAENKELKILNIGIATGATTEMLSKYGNVASIEYDKDTCDFVKEKLHIEVINASITELPFKNDQFDMVCAFDVIEHVEDDNKAYSEMKRVCCNNGYILVTVPAFMSLWSEHDLINHHYRRYTKKEINSLTINLGLKQIRSTYFNTLLFLPILFVRKISNLFKKPNATVHQSDFKRYNHSIFNSILLTIFSIELNLLKYFNFPFGVSLLEISKKVDNE